MFVYLNLDYALIQNIRIAHAFCEEGCKLVVDDADFKKFDALHTIFNLNIYSKSSVQHHQIQFLKNVIVEHSEPNVSTYGDNRPLVFPREFINYFGSKWPSHRSINYSFAGLISANRRKIVFAWARDNGFRFPISKELKMSLFDKVPYEIKRRYFGTCTLFGDGLKVTNSIVGREFPEKALDLNYYDNMLDSQFVLCPSGDFIWTYRFFEAIMCGAIPVVEFTCKSYEGFRFRNMGEDAKGLIWNEEDALFNYNKCVEALTYPEGFVRSHLV